MKELLTKISGIAEKYQKINEVTGQNFNIFKVCEIHDKEVLICRFIFQLINPLGLHNQGNIFLKKFLVDVLGYIISNENKNIKEEELIITESELENIKVYKEYVIKNDRRIDLLIKTTNKVIPIEVKIYASDQKNQCKDYSDWSKEQGCECTLYYLTLDGHFPSDYSISYEKSFNEYKNDCEIDSELFINYKLKRISFRNEIVKWIEDCIKDIAIIEKKQIVDNMIQFLNIIRELCNMGLEIENNEVKKLMGNQENFKSYIIMKQCEGYITSTVFKNLIKKLNEWAKDNGYLVNDMYNNYEKEIECLCTGGRLGNDVPGFGIDCKNTKFNCDLIVCVEVTRNDGLYYGVYIMNEKDRTYDMSELIKGSLKENSGYNNLMWPFWDYIKGNNEEVVDFAKPNNAFAELLDDKNFNKLVDDIKEKIKDLYDKIMTQGD